MWTTDYAVVFSVLTRNVTSITAVVILIAYSPNMQTTDYSTDKWISGWNVLFLLK